MVASAFSPRRAPGIMGNIVRCEPRPGIRGSADSATGYYGGPSGWSTCEHVFVTSQGTAHGRFQRALARGSLEQAEHAARELGWLSLADALSLVVVYARAGSPKFEPAAVRWLARLALEGREIGLGDLQLAAAALPCLRGARSEHAERTLLRLL